MHSIVYNSILEYKIVFYTVSIEFYFGIYGNRKRNFSWEDFPVAEVGCYLIE